MGGSGREGEKERERSAFFSGVVVPFLSQHTVEMEIRNMFLTNLSDEEELTSCFDFCADFISFCVERVLVLERFLVFEIFVFGRRVRLLGRKIGLKKSRAIIDMCVVFDNERESKKSLSTISIRVVIIMSPSFIPNTFNTTAVSACHENTMICDKRSNRVERFECSYSMLDCEEKCEFPHELSLLL